MTSDSEVTAAEGLAGIAGAAATNSRPTAERIVRCGAIEVMSGDLPAARITIQEYESMEQIGALCESDTFTELRELCGTFVKANVWVVEGP